MSDKEFDAFFRRKLENYDIPYNPKAWSSMQAKLNSAEGTGGRNFRNWITGLALLLLLGAGTFWYAGTSQNNSSEVTKSRKVPALVQSDEPKVFSKPFPQKPDSRVDAKVNGQSSSVSTEKDIVQKTAFRGEERKNYQKEVSAGSERENDLAVTRQERQAVSMTKDMVYQYEGLPYLPTQLWTPLSAVWQSESRVINKVAVSQTILPAPKNPEENSEAGSIVPGAVPFYRFGLSFTVSPDLSAIGFKGISQVGTKSGIGLEYFLFRNISLNAGIIFSHKVYSATEGYALPWGNNDDYYTEPSSIDAECNVLDLAVNLRYYALNWEKSRVYLSSGLSSYLMLSELYEYNYDDAYHTSASYRVENENQHYFKVSNFSIGYERALGQRWALQAEPFVKVPLAGVGAGKIKLSTAGMFVTLNYRLGLSRPDKK